MATEALLGRAKSRVFYTTRQVSKLLGISQGRIRNLVRQGVVLPERGQRNSYIFSFQDIVLLRTAKSLLQAGISIRRIRLNLRSLRRQIPEGMPVTGVQIATDGRFVIARDGEDAWEPESGQILLNFNVSDLEKEVARFSEKVMSGSTRSADDFYLCGCEQEKVSAERAIESYRRAIELNPRHSGAVLNLGKLLHDQDNFTDAESSYRRVIELEPENSTAIFNLGVVLEDQGCYADSIDAYEKVLGLDETHSDAHFNLSRIHEMRGNRRAAFKHLKAYKKYAHST